MTFPLVRYRHPLLAAHCEGLGIDGDGGVSLDVIQAVHGNVAQVVGLAHHVPDRAVGQGQVDGVVHHGVGHVVQRADLQIVAVGTVVGVQVIGARAGVEHRAVGQPFALVIGVIGVEADTAPVRVALSSGDVQRLGVIIDIVPDVSGVVRHCAGVALESLMSPREVARVAVSPVSLTV